MVIISNKKYEELLKKIDKLESECFLIPKIVANYETLVKEIEAMKDTKESMKEYRDPISGLTSEELFNEMMTGVPSKVGE